ncbi:SDR family NAD(P)-dependent oxidoreductase [Fusibacter ferrireducens]|uniref:SDR family NAD(P)-dependent oxidoreductase n=1 Tax=Fusibacter ferrireducens TaxID=2785058 RepID=A0ABR9ZTF1_9FIRM|nr:SDR family NAD(P)-dependent oxidoreductase [Fusibacter ferrireducens]MBF4693761.1 SDR family NAD(P)-dependent oxidoreductase [Fusibacter ferrireducens]
MSKAIIIGASSGIGRGLAKILAEDNYDLGLMARREKNLVELQKELPTKSYVQYIDISKQDEAIANLRELITDMNGVDLVIVTSGSGHINDALDWDKEKQTIDVNVSGVTAMIGTAYKYFEEKTQGHLVVISSVGAIRGSRQATSYNASKAYISNYLEGIRCKAKKDELDITITDIRPGLIDTDMAKGEGLFWVQPLEKASKQMYKSIKQKKEIVYITKRWAVIAFVLKHMPNWIYYKM